MPPSRPAEGAAAWRARAAGGYEGALAGPGGSPIAWQLPRIQLSEGLVASSREAAKERLDGGITADIEKEESHVYSRKYLL